MHVASNYFLVRQLHYDSILLLFSYNIRRKLTIASSTLLVMNKAGETYFLSYLQLIMHCQMVPKLFLPAVQLLRERAWLCLQ
jgi:hypothetical protein